MECFGPISIAGTLSSSAISPNGCLLQSLGGFSGGTLDFASDAPFVMAGGSSSSIVPTINSGAFHWDTGNLFDFTNSAATRGDCRIGAPIGGTIGSPVLKAEFENNGYVLQSGSPLLLDSQSLFTNASGATYEILNSNIQSSSGASGHLFQNAGTFLKNGDGSNGGSSLSAPFTSTGRLEVIDDFLRLTGPTQISNIVAVDRSTNADALLEFAQGSTNPASYAGVEYRVTGGGLIEFESGNHVFSGLHQSDQTSGLIHFRSGGADLVVEAGTSAELAFSDSAPLRFGTDNNSPEIRLAGPLTNTGRIDLFLAELYGPEAFRNRGEIYLDNTWDIGGPGEPGQLLKSGLIDFPTLDGRRIRIADGSLLLNDELGGPAGNLTRGTILLGSFDEITSSASNPTSLQFQNKSHLLFPDDGTASINVIFEQTGSDQPLTDVPRGSLTFSRDVRLMGGIMRSSYQDFTTDDDPSVIRFTEDVVIGDTTIELGNGGEFVFAGSTSGNDLITLESTLFARGDDIVRMNGGTLLPEPGNGNTGFNCSQDTAFELVGGVVGATGESLANVGTFRQTGGEITGTFTNGGTQLIDNGTIDATFQNNEEFTWVRGTIADTFTNGLPQTPEAGILTIDGPLNGRVLAPSSTLSNWNEINQSSSLRCRGGSRVIQNRGIYTLTEGASISEITENTGQVFEMNEGTLRSNNPAGGSHVISLETFDGNGGLIQANQGDLVIRPDILTLDGGTLRSESGTQLIFNGDPTGSGVDQIHTDGRIVFDLLSSSAPSTLTLKAGGTLSGSGELLVDLTQNGEAAPGNSVGTLTLTGDLDQGATASTTIEISPTGNDLMTVSGDAQLGGTLTIELIDGAIPQPGQTFTILTTSSVTGTFSGITPPAGGPGFDITYNPDSVVLTVVTVELDYDDWAAEEFSPDQLDDPEISGPNADPDKDLVSNLFEFIMGTSPLSGGSQRSIQFTTLPDPGNPGQRFVAFSIPTVPGRLGYQLEILALNALENPGDDSVVSSTTIDGGNSLELTSSNSLIGVSRFFVLRASLTTP